MRHHVLHSWLLANSLAACHALGHVSFLSDHYRHLLAPLAWLGDLDTMAIRATSPSVLPFFLLHLLIERVRERQRERDLNNV